jgi:class 3 adenylate cyclase
LQKVDFEINDDILAIHNVGNVLYNRSVDVNIGSDVMALNLTIDVGATRKFDLNAPDGRYEVVVGDGRDVYSRSVLLTGRALALEDLNKLNILKNYSSIWIFLIFILSGTGIVFFIRSNKGKTFSKDNLAAKSVDIVSKFGRSGNKKDGNIVRSRSIAKRHGGKGDYMIDRTSNTDSGAESNLVLDGEKLPGSIVSIAVKNYSSFNDDARERLKKIVTDCKGKGLVDWREEYVFVVFSPLVTRTYKNEKLAVNMAHKVAEKLKNYNKKAGVRIDFGIGVHSGDMLVSKSGGKLKYTGVGNVVSFAKRMSRLDSEKVVVGEDVRRKLGRDLKVEKGEDIVGKPTFVVLSFRNGDEDAVQLKNLLKRHKC